MGLVLNTERMRVVERNERGNVTYRKRYQRGDVVDTSHMDEAHVENLKESGVLVDEDSEEATDDAEGEDGSPVAPAGPVPSDTTTGRSDEGSATLAPSPDDADNSTGGAPVANDENEGVTEFDSMTYAELQAEAKERDLKYVGVSYDDLLASVKADSNN